MSWAIFSVEGGEAHRVWWAGDFETSAEASAYAEGLWTPGDILKVAQV